jgi:2-iminobutanoate/2-iminopropanoate deaminase
MPGVEVVSDEVAYPPRFGSPTALAIRVGEQIFVSGMLPWDRERRVVGVGDVRAQTRQTLKNIEATLAAAGATLRDIVKITFYLTDVRDKEPVWEVRREMFGDHRPASTLVEVRQLVDPQAKLEVEAIAFRGAAPDNVIV